MDGNELDVVDSPDWDYTTETKRFTLADGWFTSLILFRYFIAGSQEAQNLPTMEISFGLGPLPGELLVSRGGVARSLSFI